MPNNYYGWFLPFDASAHGAAIDRMIVVLHLMMFALFFGWLVFMLIAILRFRRQPGRPAVYHPRHFKLPTYIEVAVALAEVLFLVGFSFPIMNQVRNQFPDPAKAVQIRVVAEQFAWNIHYPGPDGVFGKGRPDLMSATNPVGLDAGDPAAGDDIVAINQLHVPVNTPVIAQLSSKDVIHSFGIPVMRVKQDMIPGEAIASWFEARKTGNFEIACAQLCGLGHYRMRGFFTVDTEEAYQKWLSEQPAFVPKAPEPAPPAVVETAPTP